MVHLLINHFAHGKPGVVAHVTDISGEEIAARTAERYLAPQYNPRSVAQVVYGFAVRIVGKTHCGCPYGTYKLHISPVFLGGQRRADTLEVVVAVESVQVIWPSVEREAPVRVNREAAQSERLAHLVDGNAVLQQFNVNGIEVRVAESVPQVRLLYTELHRHGAVQCIGRILQTGLRRLRGHGFPLVVGHSSLDLVACGFVAQPKYGCYANRCAGLGHAVLTYLNA